MRHIILFDTDIRESLLPFTYTRPVCDIRLGILTITEKWRQLEKEAEISFITPEHLEPLYPISINDDNYLINGGLLPTQENAKEIRSLDSGEAVMLKGELVAARLSRAQFEQLLVKQDMDRLKGYEGSASAFRFVSNLAEIADVSVEQIGADMQLLSLGQPANQIEFIRISGEHPVFIHPSSKVEQCLINADDGPVYIGARVHIMDGAKLRGPVAIGHDSIIKSHAFLSKGVCIGPHSEVGGEVKHSVFLGYSNKSHEGYIGDSVIGEWCNLGALTSNSNLRNSFTYVQVWSHDKNQVVSTGKRKCGFFMGDYSRTAIHTKINSGTVIGASCHVFGEGTAKVFLPSFTWGGITETSVYDFDKAVAAASIFCSFKDQILGESKKAVLQAIFSQSAVYHDMLHDKV
jgi:UDP-N-acetylglucosamine diphosphorylase/glucosamine-1-phosphate N-acetyltransferase